MFSLRSFVLLIFVSLLLCPAGFAADAQSHYRYITAADLETRLKDKAPTNIIDIQVAEEFAKGHIKGATPTYAYPVKSDADKAKLAAVMEPLKSNSDPVVIVCPRGAGGATRTYDYLLAQGIAPERLLILEKGQEGWTCDPLTERK